MAMDFDSGPPKRQVLMERRVMETKVIETLDQSLGVQGKGSAA